MINDKLTEHNLNISHEKKHNSQIFQTQFVIY